MNNRRKTYHIHRICLLALAIITYSLQGHGQDKGTGHPCLIIPEASVSELREAINTYPLWQATVEEYLQKADEIIAQPIDVPVPKDPAGGYTHSQHKLNAKAIKLTGVAYLVSGEEKYACYAKALLLEYAAEYPKYGEHPVKQSYAPGKLFWQQLNEAVWLVDAIQGYDAIYNFLSNKEKIYIEEDLLKPFADFLSVENMHVFNRLHNHGVWAVAAVGMTGISCGDEELIFRALYGLKENGKPVREKYSADVTGLEAGFLVQSMSLFSPDGYYTEGPYYQRYAMTPFLMLAQSIDNNIPKLDIMNFGNGMYIKAVEILVDLSDTDGRYLPVNDAMKGMSLYSPESVASLSFLYTKTNDPGILYLLKDAQVSYINGNSLQVIKDLAENKQVPLKRSSKLISDGIDGKQGGLALIRDEEDKFCVVLKCASHGLSHGHFDRLNIFYYHEENEVLTDYGSARFVNIKAKEGGRYLPENSSYAKQTIAHNTVVVDQISHFGSVYKEAQKCHSDLVYSDIENIDEQFVCVKESKAYEGIDMLRITGLINDEEFSNPLLIDVFKVSSDKVNDSYDFPFHFDGSILNVGFEYNAFQKQLQPLGDTYGYQHLWKIGEGKPSGESASISWLDNKIIYTLTSAVDENSDLILTRTGAGDPNYNLRVEPALIIRETKKKDHVFASVLETHGNQNESTEMVSNQEAVITGIKTLPIEGEYVAIEFETRKSTYIFLSTIESDQYEKEHSLSIAGMEYKWTGNYTLIKTIQQ
ncbi:heparinase II/III family protein [Bacteroidota bacterium]